MDKIFLLKTRHPLFAGWGCDRLEDENVSFENSCVSRFLTEIVLYIKEKNECLETYPFLTLNSPQLCASGEENIKTSWVINFENYFKFVRIIFLRIYCLKKVW